MQAAGFGLTAGVCVNATLFQQWLPAAFAATSLAICHNPRRKLGQAGPPAPEACIQHSTPQTWRKGPPVLEQGDCGEDSSGSLVTL
jgi:hypothetical protein